VRLQLPSFETPLPEALDEDAAALLEEAEGVVDVARTSYIGYTLAYLQESMPELYVAIKDEPSRPDAHAALVEITWDAIAAFMPVTHSSKPTQEGGKRLAAIARVSLPDDGDASFLDVGCGNGVLLPFLTAVGMPAASYRGIDLSSRMIDLAQRAHGSSGAAFVEASFDDQVKSGAKFDSIVFNGALQFFEDQPATLAAAAAMLSEAEDARIVVSHLSGARFVRQELADNPQTVSNTMPFLSEMQRIAASIGMQVVLPSFLGEEPEEIEQALQDFYLVIFRKAPPDEPADGDGGLASLDINLPEIMPEQ